MKQFNTDTEESQLPEGHKPTYIKEQHNNNCQQFFGPIINGTFIMPAAQPSNIAQPQAKESENGVASGATSEEAEAKLTTEDEELLLPIFKGNRENLQQFFAEVKGAAPTRITANVNVWIEDGRICKMNMKNLWRILKEKGIYNRTYQNWNTQVK